MKKRANIFLALVLALNLFATTSIAPRRADAGWGLIIVSLAGSSQASTALLSVPFFLGAVGGGLTADAFLSNDSSVWSFLVAGLCIIGGLYLLDGDSVASPLDLHPLSDEGAQRAGFTAQEHQAYEHELELINSVREEVMLRSELELSALAPPELNAARAARVVKAQWLELSQGLLSLEAVSAVEKLGRAIRN